MTATLTPAMVAGDAWTAAEILREISAGHEDAADALATAAGLGHLSTESLEALRDAFDAEP
jgi:hypothetical protein